MGKPARSTGKMANTAKTPAARTQVRAANPPPSAAPAPKRRKTDAQQEAKPRSCLNAAPTRPLVIFAVGTGDCGELGLGPTKTEKSRPSRNSHLDPGNPKAEFKIVQICCGGMHTVALTSDSNIVTWGTNDNFALGRDTEWDGVLRDVGDEDEHGELNPYESTPTAIPSSCFARGTKFAQVAAGDSCSFALTTDGLVYGWGTFRDSSGNQEFGYDADGKLIKCQKTPVLIPSLKDIVQVACGADHALALDKKGTIWGWGSHEQNQLGRRLFGRHTEHLIPRRVEVCRGGAKYIASGEFHAFAIDKRDNVWAWGLNSFGEAGYSKGAGGDSSLLPYPMKVADLCGKQIELIAGGAHHSAAVSRSGELLVWGRMDGGQLGIEFTPDQLSDATLIRRDERNNPRICLRPTRVPHIGVAAYVACGTDHTIFVNREGKAFSTGIGTCSQLGLGSDDDVDVAKAVRMEKGQQDRVLCWAGAGGQFSMLGSVHDV
ncbi:hypothetical protein PWT90_03527 [Aphanocladium album]|nr:hypothetical protein PWT90_03527 [Aphanocladium album]